MPLAFPAKAGTHLPTAEGWKAELALGGFFAHGPIRSPERIGNRTLANSLPGTFAPRSEMARDLLFPWTFRSSLYPCRYLWRTLYVYVIHIGPARVTTGQSVNSVSRLKFARLWKTCTQHRQMMALLKPATCFILWFGY